MSISATVESIATTSGDDGGIVHEGMDISQAQRVRAIQLTGDWEYAGLERLLTAESAQPGQR